MSNQAADVFVPSTGRICFAAAGTGLPTSTAASLAAFAELGYISDNGITWTPASTNAPIKAFQNGDIVADSETEHTYQADFECLETNETVLDLWYSGNYDTPAGRGVIKGNQIKRGVWVFDEISGSDIIRKVVPDGKIIGRKPISVKNGSAETYGFTIQCYADVSGNKSYEYHSTVGAS